MRHRELARIGAQEDRHPSHLEDLPGRVAHRPEHGLDVERLADGLVERAQGPRFPVVPALGLEVPGTLHGEAHLTAQGLQEVELLLREELSRARGHVQDAAARSFEVQGNAGVGHRLAQTFHDRGHAGALRRVAHLHPVTGREDLRAQAVREALGLDLAQILCGQALLRGETQLSIGRVGQEHPGRVESQAAQDLLERGFEDDGDVLLVVDP